MAAEVRQPVAIRVTRPYANEDEFLDHEIDTLTRTSVTLIGAQSRPQGVILRFEVTLANGTPLMRGEGRVIAYKQDAFDRLPGLTLRFTRLDKKTKALVDRAAMIREERARAALRASIAESGESVLPPPPLPGPMPSVDSLADEFRPTDPDIGPVVVPAGPAALSTDDNGLASSHGTEDTRVAAVAPAAAAPAGPAGPAPSGRDRESLLLRLRERARALPPETVAEILHSHTHTSTPE